MERHFDEELNEVKLKLLGMADASQEMIGLAVRMLMERDPAPAERVRELEDRVNRMENEIEDRVIRLFALRQPIARDLRFLTAALKITNDLERIADQACNIAETTAYLLKEPPFHPNDDVRLLAELAQKMIRDSIEAFVKHDPGLAHRVCRADDEVDRINERIFRDLLERMTREPKGITRAVDLILVSRNLERAADHATNIGEEVIFIEEGKNVKHHFGEAK